MSGKAKGTSKANGSLGVQVTPASFLQQVGGAFSRGWLVWSSVLGCVRCVTHGVSEWKKEKKEW
eukprot:1156791-Pelagomonas_calceolata.AAC.8